MYTSIRFIRQSRSLYSENEGNHDRTVTCTITDFIRLNTITIFLLIFLSRNSPPIKYFSIKYFKVSVKTS